MLSNDYFYFSLIRKYVVLFGSCFNDLIIQRTNHQTGEITQIVNVPISYAEKEKMLTRVLSDPGINRKDNVLLPRMSFFMDGFTYDNSRKLASNQKYVIEQMNNKVGFQFMEVPWDYHFTLSVYVKNNEDATKILEQIVPFFSPSYTLRAKLIPDRPPIDIPITLREISHEWSQDEKFTDRSILIWNLRFSLKGAFYCPIHQAALIDVATIDFFAGDGPNNDLVNNHAFGISNILYNFDEDNINTLDLSVNTYLTVNGTITTTIPPVDWQSNTEYGVITTINPGGES